MRKWLKSGIEFRRNALKKRVFASFGGWVRWTARTRKETGPAREITSFSLFGKTRSFPRLFRARSVSMFAVPICRMIDFILKTKSKKNIYIKKDDEAADREGWLEGVSLETFYDFFQERGLRNSSRENSGRAGVNTSFSRRESEGWTLIKKTEKI